MKGIIFGTESILAMLDDRKTMTRRVMKPQPAKLENITLRPVNESNMVQFWGIGTTPICEARLPCKPGDILYVKETWRRQNYGYDSDTRTYEGQELQYRADFTDEGKALYGRRGGCMPCVWRSPMFMPQKAARLFIRITDVRIERLQDISTSDCEKEGMILHETECGYSMANMHDDIVGQYAALWEKLNGKKKVCSWEDNPFVWAYTFERITKEEAENEA